MMLDDKRTSSGSVDVTRIGLPLTVNKIRDLDELSSQNGDDGIDNSGQNLGSFLPSEVA
jgi:hypothetical protein